MHCLVCHLVTYRTRRNPSWKMQTIVILYIYIYISYHTMYHLGIAIYYHTVVIMTRVNTILPTKTRPDHAARVDGEHVVVP